MKITKSKLIKLIENIVDKKIKNEKLNENTINLIDNGNKAKIQFDIDGWDDKAYGYRAIKDFAKGDNDSIADDIEELAEENGIEIDWDRPFRLVNSTTVEVFVVK